MKKVFLFFRRNIRIVLIYVIIAIMFFVMGLLAKNLSEVTHISSDSWLTFIGTIVGSLAGAYFGANFAYSVTKRQDKQKLRKDLEIKVTEQLLESIKIFNDSDIIKSYPNYIYIDLYNIALSTYELNKNNDLLDSKTKNDILNQVNEYLKTAFEILYEIKNDWYEYVSKFDSIINIFESQKIILINLIDYKDLLVKKFEEIMGIYNKVYLIYFNIKNNIVSHQKIDKESYKEIDNNMDKLHNAKKEIKDITKCFTVKLQNEFLSDIFNYEIPLEEISAKNMNYMSNK